MPRLRLQTNCGPATAQNASKPTRTPGAVNTSSFLQVLGLGTDVGDAAPSILLFFDQRRYLFNAGEGFQRLCVEHKVKLSRMDSVLLTRLSSDAAGGLPGMCLTMADSGGNGLLSNRPDLGLIGPLGMRSLADTIRTLTGTQRFRLGINEFGDSAQDLGPVVANGLVTITPVMILPTAQTAALENGHPAKRQRTSDVAAPSTPAACYLCQLAPVAGKFLPARAKELGVTLGPDFGRLKNGEAVLNCRQETVHPSSVMEPGQPGPAALILDCPHSTYLPALSSSPALRDLDPAALSAVIHLAPAEVAALPEYRKWASRFGDSTQQIFVNSAAAGGGTVMTSSAVLQARMNCIHPHIFPMHQTGIYPKDLPASLFEEAPSHAIGRNMLKFWLRPLSKLGLDEDLEEARRSALAEQPELEAMLEACTAAAAAAEAPPEVVRAGNQSLAVTMLGTGAAIPSKYRNVTGIHLDLFKCGGMLLDCGEGSLGQLRRRHGRGADDVVRALQCAWISHIHADHHIGLVRVLAARVQLLGHGAPPLPVIGPWALKHLLAKHDRLMPINYRFIDCCQTLNGAPMPSESDAALLAETTRALGLVRLQSVRVDHCNDAYGLVIESKDGWKVAYSGDTRPCDALVDAAKGATLLIHEATFEDAMEAEARAKRHSMTGEAIGVGARAGAYRTMLTHFSQRYPKMPVVDASFAASTCIASDLMSFNLTDLPLLPHLVAPLSLLLATAEAEEVQDNAGESEALL